MASLLEAIGAALSRKTLSDEQLINRAAIRSARGDEPKTEKEIEAIADAMQRLGKDNSYLAQKIEVVQRHDQHAAAEKDREAKAAEAAKLQVQYDAIQAELEPINKRLKAVGNKLAPLLEAVQFSGSIVGKAAEIRTNHPELFGAEK